MLSTTLKQALLLLDLVYLCFQQREEVQWRWLRGDFWDRISRERPDSLPAGRGWTDAETAPCLHVWETKAPAF